MRGRGRQHRVELFFAEEWQLDTPSGRRAHGDKLVTIDVGVNEPPLRSVFSLPPAQRLAALKLARQRRLKALERAVAKLRAGEFVVTSHGIRCNLRVAELDRIRALPGVGYVRVRHVVGLRRTPPKPRDEWYAVRGRVMIQVEGQTKGLQEYEDRILLVRARSYREAERRALREFAAYSRHLYLNPSGRRVRWKLEKIVDLYETDLEDLDPKGTEVWSSLHSRRMRKPYEWHPGR